MLVNFEDKKMAVINLFTGNDELYQTAFGLISSVSEYTENSFINVLIRTSRKSSGSQMIWTGEEKNALSAMEDEYAPKRGFSGLIVVKIFGDFDTYYTKVWHEHTGFIKKTLSSFIKDRYEIGEVDEYTMEFKKIK